MPIRVLVVDDDPMVRMGLKFLLDSVDDIAVAAEAGDGEEALAHAGAGIDVILMDLRMPRMDGLTATRRVRALQNPPHVIVLTTWDVDDAVMGALEAGASGYLGKACDAAELLRAVRDVARGKKYLASAIAQGIALSGMTRDAASPFDMLTPREMEVALLLNQGMRQEAIARRLSLSAKTINTHKSRLFEKLGIRDSIALARLVSQYGLVDPAHAVH